MLSNYRFWITRPNPAGELLCDAIREVGGDAVHFPTIEIFPVKTAWSGLKAQDFLIFTSPQAVYHSVRQMPALPATIKIIAIGPGTRDALNKANIPASTYPENSCTEELLLLPCFESIKSKKIGLVKGEGGRELLASELKARGAIVTPFIVYERKLAKKKAAPRIGNRDIILCTSCDILRNLISALEDQQAILKQTPLIVISDRIRLLARALGFKKIVLASNPNINTIIKTVGRLYVRDNGKIGIKK